MDGPGGDDDHEGETGHDHRNGHEKRHEKGHDDGHSDSHESRHEHDAGPSSFRAVYSFACAGEAAPGALAVRSFERFPRSGLLRVQVIGPSGQSAATLTPDDVELAF